MEGRGDKDNVIGGSVGDKISRGESGKDTSATATGSRQEK